MRFLLLALCFTWNVMAQTTTRIQARDVYGIDNLENILANPSFDKNSLSWTASGLTAGAATAGSNLGRGTRSATVDASAGGQTFTSSQVAIPGHMLGQNAVAYCRFRNPGTTGGSTTAYQLRVIDGSSNVLTDTTATNVIPTSTQFQRHTQNFIMPTSGTVALQVRSTNSTEAEMALDDCYLGLADNLSQVSQATFYAGMEQLPAAGCSYTQTTSSGISNFVALGVGTGCNAWTTEGAATAVGNNDHRLVLNNMPPGVYQFELTGTFFASSNNVALFRLSDGTNTYQPQTLQNNNAGVRATNIMKFFVTVSSSASRTYTIQSSDDAAITTGWDNAGSSIAAWKVTRFPLASEIAVRPDLRGWRVDATISGANPSLGTTSVSSYSEIQGSSLTLSNASGGTIIPAQIACATTNPPVGSDCGVNNESLGVSFVLPIAGEVLACASFTHNFGTGASGTIETAFQLVETPTNAVTLTQEGRAKIVSGTGLQNSSYAIPYRLCGTFNFATPGQKVIRLMYEQAIAGTVNASVVYGDQNAGVGQRDIKFEIYPVGQSVPNPILVGGVSSNSSGMERVERATVANSAVCSASPCTIDRQSGSWLTSVTRSGAGTYALNIAAGIFSGTPSCTFTPLNFGGYIQRDATVSATVYNILTRNFSVSNVDGSFEVICMGPR